MFIGNKYFFKDILHQLNKIFPNEREIGEREIHSIGLRKIKGLLENYMFN